MCIEKFMAIAMDLANTAFQENEVPVGAVVVKDGKIIGKGFNQVVSTNSVSSHAEILAINNASQTINNYRLKGCEIYVTLEPCHMCAKALIDARLSRLVYSSFEPKTGAIHSIDHIFDKPFNHKIDYQHGLLKEESSIILKNFFKSKRH